MSLSLFWIWRKSEQRKKGSKTTAQGVYRLLDDLRSCYEAIRGFSLGARLWFCCCGEAAKPTPQSSRLFVCACRCRWAQSWEELSITGVSDSMPDTCFESVRNVIFQKEFKEKWDACLCEKDAFWNERDRNDAFFHYDCPPDNLFFFFGCSQLNPLQIRRHCLTWIKLIAHIIEDA